ncbi:MAG: hypothetical protein QM220_08530, partial [Atribacterota bacterium]|nr:hypothetical protein [Atribacterota bacterium]
MSTVTLVLGLLGEHIENSLSPLIHMNFIRYYSLNYSYLPFQIKSNNLEKAIIGAKALGIKGLNITIPFKAKAMRKKLWKSYDYILLLTIVAISIFGVILVGSSSVTGES